MHDSVVFKIFGLEVTNVIVASWVIMLLLVVFSILATRKMKDVPGVLQNIAEWAVEALQNFFGGILGQWRMRRYFPALATFFIFIVISNYSGLLPGIGHFKGYATPTANLSVTAALSLCAFVMIHGLGFKERGVGNYLKSFLKPVAVMLPLTILEQFVRPFSLALRLYGNLYGEEMVTENLYNIFPIIVPLVMQVLSLLFCMIQALVFTMLLSIYVAEATESD